MIYELLPFLILTGSWCAIMLIYSLRKEHRDHFRRMKAKADRKRDLQTCQHEADKWQAELYNRPNSIHFSK
jgi:hypothetical protein